MNTNLASESGYKNTTESIFDNRQLDSNLNEVLSSSYVDCSEESRVNTEQSNSTKQANCTENLDSLRDTKTIENLGSIYRKIKIRKSRDIECDKQSKKQEFVECETTRPSKAEKLSEAKFSSKGRKLKVRLNINYFWNLFRKYNMNEQVLNESKK